MARRRIVAVVVFGQDILLIKSLEHLNSAEFGIISSLTKNYHAVFNFEVSFKIGILY